MSERKPTYEELEVQLSRAKEALSLQSAITTNMAEGVCLIRAHDGTIVYANPTFEKMFGYAPGEIIGKHVSVINAPTEKSPEEKVKEIDKIDVWRGEVYNVNKEGTPFWCYASISMFEHPVYGKVQVAVHIDITERKRAETALVESKVYTESIIRNFLDTLIVVDTEAKIRTVNPATCDLLGYTEKELIGQSVSIIFAKEEEEEEEVRRVFQFFRESGKAKTLRPLDTIRNRELTYKTRAGQLIPMSFNASVLTDDAGNIIGVVAGAKDITEIKRAESQRAAALEAKRKTEEHFRKVIENIFKFIPEGLLVFTDKLNIIKQNKAFQDIVKEYAGKLNYTEKELSEIISEQVKNRIANKDYADIRVSPKKDRETKNKQDNL